MDHQHNTRHGPPGRAGALASLVGALVGGWWRVGASLALGLVLMALFVAVPAGLSTPASPRAMTVGGRTVAIAQRWHGEPRPQNGMVWWAPVRRVVPGPGVEYWYAYEQGASLEAYHRNMAHAGGPSVVFHRDDLGTAAPLPGPVRRSADKLMDHRCTILAGWPLRAAIGHHDFLLGFHAAPSTEGTLILPSVAGRRPVIPLRPLWPGLLANWALLGLGSLGLLAAATPARGRWRRRRGRCPACNYEVGGLERCPECGRAAAGVSSDHFSITKPRLSTDHTRFLAVWTRFWSS